MLKIAATLLSLPAVFAMLTNLLLEVFFRLADFFLAAILGSPVESAEQQQC
jgi:hypothetical protein